MGSYFQQFTFKSSANSSIKITNNTYFTRFIAFYNHRLLCFYKEHIIFVMQSWTSLLQKAPKCGKPSPPKPLRVKNKLIMLIASTSLSLCVVFITISTVFSTVLRYAATGQAPRSRADWWLPTILSTFSVIVENLLVISTHDLACTLTGVNTSAPLQ